MDPKSILSYCRRNHTSVDFCNDILDDGETIRIFAFARDDKQNRICPFCNSKDVIIKDRPKITIKYSIFLCENLPVYIELTKIKYRCKNCNHVFTPHIDLLPPSSSISNDTRWSVYRLSSKVISFKALASIVNISLPSAIKIFTQMVHYERKKLPRVLCIDEKSFKTEYGKYVCIFSDGESGEVIDVLPGRTFPVLSRYFNKISEKERKNVEFFASDMFEGYRTIKNIYLPKSIHIIDYFHLSNLFRNTINIIRISYMKHFNYEGYVYEFLKSKWKTFLSPHIYSMKPEVYNKTYEVEGEILDYMTLLERIYNLCPKLLEIKVLYKDFYDLIDKDSEEDEVAEALDYIINKCSLSDVKSINTIGETIKSFYHEIVDTYSIKNYLNVSNAVAEGNNRFIDSIINVSFGLGSFTILRNRIMHCKRDDKNKKSTGF